jgi:hypothetical protein
MLEETIETKHFGVDISLPVSIRKVLGWDTGNPDCFFVDFFCPSSIVFGLRHDRILSDLFWSSSSCHPILYSSGSQSGPYSSLWGGGITRGGAGCGPVGGRFSISYLRIWALLEELSIVQPLKNPPAFYGTRRFNTVLLTAEYLTEYGKGKVFP